MGGFKCGCGNNFSGSHNPGQQFRLVPDELFDQVAWPAPADLDTQERQRAVEASLLVAVRLWQLRAASQ